MCGEWREHPLEDHLYAVGEMAAGFAAGFGDTEWARLAGLWHDLGKYSAEFQHYIKKASGYDPEAHLEGTAGRVDHSTAGAIHAIEQFDSYGRILAYLIAGHHAGLPDWFSAETGNAALSQRVAPDKRVLLERVLAQNPPSEILQQPRPACKPPGGAPALWIRMLFSCLVDADFLDTEAFMNAGKAETRAKYPALADLLPLFAQHMLKKTAQVPDTPVNRVRAD
ncbi:MAG: CRISPR-associated endonuclease Cas3'', partial [Burkholderiales bacterium]